MIRDDVANASDISADEITKMESNDSLPQRSDETNLLPAMHEEIISFDIVRESDSMTMLATDPSSSSLYLYSDNKDNIESKTDNSVTASSTAFIAKLDEDTPTCPRLQNSISYRAPRGRRRREWPLHRTLTLGVSCCFYSSFVAHMYPNISFFNCV